MFVEDGSDPSLGDAEAIADLLGGLASFVPSRDIATSSAVKKRFERDFGASRRDRGGRAGDSLMRFRSSDHFLERWPRFEFLPIASTKLELGSRRQTVRNAVDVFAS